MSSILQFSVDDLARVRISTTADPLWELQSAAHWPLHSATRTRLDWARRTAARLGPDGDRIERQVRAPVVQVGDLGHEPSVPGTPFFVALETVLGQPTRSWRQMTDQLGAAGLPPYAALAEGRPAALDRLGSALIDYHAAALAPYWQQVDDRASAAAAAWARTMASYGVAALLSGLHPDVTWRSPC